jgi:hypothetical protein
MIPPGWSFFFTFLGQVVDLVNLVELVELPSSASQGQVARKDMAGVPAIVPGNSDGKAEGF